MKKFLIENGWVEDETPSGVRWVRGEETISKEMICTENDQYWAWIWHHPVFGVVELS